MSAPFLVLGGDYGWPQVRELGGNRGQRESANAERTVALGPTPL